MKTPLSTSIKIAISAALLASLAACVVAPPRRVVVATPPPPLRVEPMPPSPSPNVFWVPGHWRWQGNQHVWVAGRWEGRRVANRWEPAHWEREGGGWAYVDGRWVRE